MKMLAEICDALQAVFGTDTEGAAAESNVIRRQRKFDAVSLAKTFVLAFLKNPNASDKEIVDMAMSVGVTVSHQAITQRYSWQLVDFFETLFHRVTQHVIKSDACVAPLLSRFTSVELLDSTTVTLPAGLENRFRGCGGSDGGGKSALKLQTELSLCSGAIRCIEVESGRNPDGASSRQKVSREAGSLRIADLGYFNLSVFQDMDDSNAYYLSRYQNGTTVFIDGEAVPSLANWLNEQEKNAIEKDVELGAKARLGCRLIACRMPARIATRRRENRIKMMLRKYNSVPSKESLALCDWTILITNTSSSLLGVEEAMVMQRARWQIELLFKRWKSLGRISQLDDESDEKAMARFWARMIAATIQHWLTVAAAWGNTRKQSLTRTAAKVKHYVIRIAESFPNLRSLKKVLRKFLKESAHTCKKQKRSVPGTFELLDNPGLLDYDLT